MIVDVMTRSAVSYGGNTTFSLVGDYLGRGLGEYGVAVNRLELTACFRGGRVKHPSLQPSFDDFHFEFLPKLPIVKFLRSKGRIDIEYESNVADATFLEEYGFLSAEFFNVALSEIVANLHLLVMRLKISEGFDRDRLFRDLNHLVALSPTSDEDLKTLKEEVEQARKTRLAAMSPWERLDIDWSKYHPAARGLLNDPFFWSETDDFAPHGNDTGADLLHAFKKWNSRNPVTSAHAMAMALLHAWGIRPFDFNLIEEGEVMKLVAFDPIALDTTDEAFIAVSFAAIKIRGCCDIRTREAALTAIKRERILTAMNSERWKLAAERLIALGRLEGALLNAPAPDA